MKIFERNRQKPTKRNYGYGAKVFALLQPKRAFYGVATHPKADPNGYTIVETMIFLAVSGALFLSAMLLINGQQRKTEFSTSVRDFDSKLQSIIGNVSSGYYNNPGTITCNAIIVAGVRTPNPTAGVSSQGQNQDCTFIGQYIDLSAPFDKFTITSYAGLRLNSSGKVVQTLTEAVPTPISSSAETYKLLGGVTANMKIVGGSIIKTLAITTTFNQHNSAGILDSGSSRVEMHAINGAGIDVVNPSTGVQICLSSGNQVGIVVLNTGSTRVSIASSCP